MGALVRGLAAGGVPDSTVDDVVARAEGNAFYAEELLAAPGCTARRCRSG